MSHMLTGQTWGDDANQKLDDRKQDVADVVKLHGIAVAGQLAERSMPKLPAFGCNSKLGRISPESSPRIRMGH